MSDKVRSISISELQLKQSSKHSIKTPCTPLSYSPDRHGPPNLLSPPHIDFYVPNDSWDDLTPAQVATMSPEETRQMLLRAVAHIAMLTRILREERASAAHHTLQHKLLKLEIHEVSQRYSVEIDLIRREMDRLLYELAHSFDTSTKYQRYCQNIKQRLHETLSLLNRKNELIHVKKYPLNQPNSSSNDTTYPQESNELAISNHPNPISDSGAGSYLSNENEHSSGLLSPIAFHSSCFNEKTDKKTIKESNTQCVHPVPLKKQKVSKLMSQPTKRKYALRSQQSVPISPNTSPLHSSL